MQERTLRAGYYEILTLHTSHNLGGWNETITSGRSAARSRIVPGCAAPTRVASCFVAAAFQAFGLCNPVQIETALLGSTALSPCSTCWIFPSLSTTMVVRCAH